LTGASKKFELAELDEKSHANTDETIAYGKTIAAEFTKASTTSSRPEYDYSGDVRKVVTDASSTRMIHAAFLKQLLPFQYCYRYGSLGIMAEKVVLVLAARWHGGDPRALCIITGTGLLFFAATGAYHTFIPRWLGLSARFSTFLASLMAVTHAHLSISEHVVNYILVTVFAVVAAFYLCAFNPMAIVQKIYNKMHLPWAIDRVKEYQPPEDTSGHGSEKWLKTKSTGGTPLNCYDTLVMSPAQFECMIAYRSTEGEGIMQNSMQSRFVCALAVFAFWLLVATSRCSVLTRFFVLPHALFCSPSTLCVRCCTTQPTTFDVWIRFGVKYRPLLENMVDLVLVKRGLAALGPSIAALANLETLDVHQNKGLVELPWKAIILLRKLKTLDASNCNISGSFHAVP
jgi:hypothetical protein